MPTYSSPIKMDPEDFIIEFVKFFNCEVSDSDVPSITKSECYVVWYNYTLGNAKALVSTVRPDHKYYEMTFDAELNKLYIDEYLKVRHDEVKF